LVSTYQGIIEEGIMMDRQTIENLKKSLKAGVEVVAVPQLFETPNQIAERIADLLLIPSVNEHDPKALKSWRQNDFRILEPSAGKGSLIGALGTSWHPRGKLTAVEINGRLCSYLENEFPLTEIVHDDFLECWPEETGKLDIEANQFLGYFDRIAMNPPFINGSDIKHIKHAVKFLKPGGRLVSICSNGPRQQRILKPLAIDSGGFYEVLPAGTFKDQGTNWPTALLIICGE